MGKVSLIAAIFVTLIGFILTGNLQLTSRETDDKQAEYHGSQLSRELASKARKLILANWIELGGVTGVAPFATLSEGGGTMSVEHYAADPADGRILDFTVRGVYDGSVHEIRSRFKWDNFALNPLQITAPDLDIEIDPNADLNFPSITIDDLSLYELDDVLIQDLGLGLDLSVFGLGLSNLVDEVEGELSDEGITDITVTSITSAERATLEEQNGLYFPNQVQQAVENYIISHPGSQTVLLNDSDIPSTFGTETDVVLRISNDVTMSSDLVGQGILIIEGDFIVPEGVTFAWDGVVLVKPPVSSLNPQIDLSGIVNINGSLVIIQEGVPNTGHMDLTVNYDADASWGNQYGDTYPWWKHTHDFSGTKSTTQVGFITNQVGFTVYNAETKFNDLLSAITAPSDSIFLEILNHGSHGQAIMTLDVAGYGLLSYPVAAGFDPSIADPGNHYRSLTFPKNDLLHLWDSVEGHPGCNDARYWDGPRCVATAINRYNSLALRVHRINAGIEEHLYDASLYWHRRQDEEEEFEDEMADLITEILSPNYGVDLNIGSNVTLSVDPTVTAMIGGLGGSPIGMANLGTWHRHWEPGETGNPYYVVPSSDD